MLLSLPAANLLKFPGAKVLGSESSSEQTSNLLNQPIQGSAKKTFVQQFVTFKISMRSVPNLVHINVISFLILTRHLFESTLGNKVAPSSE